MNPFDALIPELKSLVTGDSELSAAITQSKGWLDYGIPLAAGPFPCLRFDGLICVDDKLNRYQVNIKLWSKDKSYQFYTLVEAFRRVLATSDMIYSDGYLDRPETGLSCAVFPCTFIA